jgi:hypothetical protein
MVRRLVTTAIAKYHLLLYPERSEAKSRDPYGRTQPALLRIHRRQQLWVAGLLRRESAHLKGRVTVVGHREKHFGSQSEYARIVLSVHPAEHFNVVDNVPYRKELEALGIAWPDPVVFGLLDVLMFAEYRPIYKMQVILEDAAYHEIDSSENAFREAGRDAGRKIVEAIGRDGLTES